MPMNRRQAIGSIAGAVVVPGTPIFVPDMFEHAYALDYGSAHATYIEAFFADLNWAALDKRWLAARALK